MSVLRCNDIKLGGTSVNTEKALLWNRIKSVITEIDFFELIDNPSKKNSKIQTF